MRHLNTVALVSYNDPTDFYRSKIEVVEDRDGITRFGVRKIEITAFGCTSRGQAQRVGLYHLYTSRMETGGVSFSVGLDGVIPQPGSLTKIADRNRAGRRLGGRISTATTTAITVDADHPIAIGNSLTVNMPDGSMQARNVTGVAGRIITVSPAFGVAPSSQAAWSVDAADLVTQTIRVISVREQDGIIFSIDGVAHHPGKFLAIDNNVRLDPLPISVVPPRSQLAPTDITIAEYYTYHQGITRHNAEITWTPPDNAVSYDVQWRRDNSDWIQMPRSGEITREIQDIHAGSYVVRVRAINGLDVPSLWAYSSATELDGLAGEPPTLTSIVPTGEIMAIRLDWVYPAVPNIISFVELRASLDNVFANSYHLTQIAYPATSYTVYGLGYGTEMWFWGRLIDKNGLPGEWYPLSSGAGVYGISSTDASDILAYFDGQIGAGQLAPGLIEEITEDAAEGIMDQISGDLTGDDVLDAVWFSGDDDDHFVGTVTTTSAYNHGDYMEARRTTSLAASMGDLLAVIREELIVQASETSALASQVTTLAASVGDMEAIVEQTSEAVADLDGALSASWQVKTQVRSDGRVVQAGVALGASIDPSGTSRSEFLVMADTIAFLTKINGTLHAPFVFDVANDTFILNNAIIGNASIGSAKLSDWLESDEVGPGGVRVLRLNFRTGEIQLNPAASGAGRMTLNSSVIQVYDSSNVLRVRMGIW